VAFICLLAVVVITRNIERGTINFLITFIPSLIGVFFGFSDDNRLTDEERRERRCRDKRESE
jgi:hypothetical protein